jgi:hypothetical protein
MPSRFRDGDRGLGECCSLRADHTVHLGKGTQDTERSI